MPARSKSTVLAMAPSAPFLLSLVVFLLVPVIGRAGTTIEPGFDLFVTDPSSSFKFVSPVWPNPQVVNFEGSPLGTFDFGSGLVGVGDTDTIVKRTQIANLGGGSDTVDIELVALSLVSTAPVDLGFGAGFELIFMTLHTSSPSTQSTMTIFDTGEGDPHGTFDSTRNFTFDIVGGIGGQYATIEVTPNSSSSPWRHAPGITVIDGVNHLLNGVNESADLWPTELVEMSADGFLHRALIPATLPSVPTLSPAGLLVFAAGLLGCIVYYRRRL